MPWELRVEPEVLPGHYALGRAGRASGSTA